MNRNYNFRLALKLTLIFVLALVDSAEAAVIYSGIQNLTGQAATVLNQMSSTDIDLNSDGIMDFSVLAQRSLVSISALGQNKVSGIGGRANVFWTGDPIGTRADFVADKLELVYSSRNAHDDLPNSAPAISTGNWASEQPGFAGLQFYISGVAHFGWVLLKADASAGYGGKSSSNYTIHGWAYEDTPNTPIVAGATSSDPINSAVPEPSSFALFAFGAAGLAAWKKAVKR